VNHDKQSTDKEQQTGACLPIPSLVATPRFKCKHPSAELLPCFSGVRAGWASRIGCLRNQDRGRRMRVGDAIIAQTR
jgi:hypothetical protein